MPIPRQLLDDEEEVLVDVRPHWVFVSGPATLTVLVLAGAFAIGYEFPQAPITVVWVLGAMVALPALWLAGRVVKWLGVSVVLTTHRLIYRRGIVRRDVTQLRLQRIAEVHLAQSMLDRLIGAGRLVVEVQGDPQPLFIDDVRRPRSLQRLLNEQLDQLDGAWPPGRISPSTPSGRPADTGAPAFHPPSFDRTPPHGTVIGTTLLGVDDTGSVAATRPKAVVDPTSFVVPPAGSIPDQLIQLDDLRRRGILTDAEFTAKKAELLRRL